MTVQSWEPLYSLVPATHSANTMPVWPSSVDKHLNVVLVSHTYTQQVPLTKY